MYVMSLYCKKKPMYELNSIRFNKDKRIASYCIVFAHLQLSTWLYRRRYNYKINVMLDYEFSSNYVTMMLWIYDITMSSDTFDNIRKFCLYN